MWDVFVCHATEDKDVVARPLAERLRALGLNVWYDELTLCLGDSLRESIDYGLANSRFGIVIFSPAFFKKNWPKKELDGLFAREIEGGKVILPVWHDIDREEVMNYSSIIADKFAAKTANGLDEVVREIMRVIDPKGAYLSNGRLGVVVTPASLSLGGKGWATHTSFIISNKTDNPVYSVCIKALILSDEVESSDLTFDPLEKTSVAKEKVGGWLGLDAEAFRVNGYDSEKRKVAFLFLNSLAPMGHRSFILKNSRPVAGEGHSLTLEVHSFQEEPVTILKHRDGSIALPISFKENIVVNSISLLMSRE